MENSDASASPSLLPMPSVHSSFTRRIKQEMEQQPERMKALEKLKSSISDCELPHYFDNWHLCRFLKARGFNPEKAERMLRRHLRWRQEFGIDELMRNYTVPEALRLYHPGGWGGCDREGNPVWCEASGGLDPQGLVRAVSRLDFVRSRMLLCEQFLQHKLPEVRKLTGKPVYSATFLCDMRGYGRRHIHQQFLEMQGEVLRLCEQNYPETMEAGFVINAGSIFPLIFKLAKPMLHPDTQQKLQVLGQNYQEQLNPLIAPDQRPASFGGTRPDADFSVCPGGYVPESLYRQLDNPQLLLQQSIGRRSKFSLDLDVPNDWREAYIQWQFATEDGDLGFEIRHAGSGSVLLSLGKVNCGSCPSVGAVRCPQRGPHTIVFDNSFSWLRSKRLRYSLSPTDSRPSVDIVGASIVDDDAASDSESEENSEEGRHARQEAFEHDLSELLRTAEAESA